ncbi:MAG: hypothetical protein Q9169_007324 [Polycauliona sp. 2 TL-2023]
MLYQRTIRTSFVLFSRTPESSEVEREGAHHNPLVCSLFSDDVMPARASPCLRLPTPSSFSLFPVKSTSRLLLIHEPSDEPSDTSKANAKKQAPTSHPSSTNHQANPSSKQANSSSKHVTEPDGPATAAYKSAQMKIPPRQPTPHGSEGASSQACESADVSESEWGVMRRERKDVMHQGPGGEFEARGGR